VNTYVQKTIKKMHMGDSAKDIIFYWFPEMVSAIVLISLPPIVDSLIVSNSQGIIAYGALSITTNLLHLFIKLAEAIPVASVAIIGRYNGAKLFAQCGDSLGSVFWISVFFGGLQFFLIGLFATNIYHWIGVSEEIIRVGIPFLKLKSLGIFFTFILFSFVFFMRAIKNTRMPMIINFIGIGCFCFLDYAFVLGKFGFPQAGLYGSAIATIIQYLVMNAIAVSYLLLKADYKKYFPRLFCLTFSKERAFATLKLSGPIVIDKGSFAMLYVWLSKMIAPLGTYAITTYDVIKNLERFAFIPAIAFAQIITFLVSNRLGAGDLEGAASNIKKVLLLSFVTVSITLGFLCFKASYFVGLFDKGGQFADSATTAFIIISLFVIFDITQVILAGALRGAGDVKAVMWGRVFSLVFFFMPISYFFSKFPFKNSNTTFIVIYSSYYIATGVMSIIFFVRIKSRKWQKRKI
jgi:putative MATE family efflux protein